MKILVREEMMRFAALAKQSSNGVRIASSNTIESLMENDFRLVVNDSIFEVITPRQERLSKALNVGEHQLQKERELFTQLEELKDQLEPLEKKRMELAQLSEKRTNVLTWVGLGMMSVQFGILARLTWWEYSWDIMEPVTYFVTYGTAMACYAYYVLTKQEYILPDVKDRQFLITFHKKAKKQGLDVHRYNELQDSIARIEADLRRLRDPLQIHLPPAHLQESQPFGNLTDKQGSPILSPFARAHEQIRNLLKRKS
ncbi:hypothetical protein B566_EDAN012873 [Ephemera danica]|nr:hypothetical protein B566_EDAN012873 [Ephemera danica]